MVCSRIAPAELESTLREVESSKQIVQHAAPHASMQVQYPETAETQHKYLLACQERLVPRCRPSQHAFYHHLWQRGLPLLIMTGHILGDWWSPRSLQARHGNEQGSMVKISPESGEQEEIITTISNFVDQLLEPSRQYRCHIKVRSLQLCQHRLIYCL